MLLGRCLKRDPGFWSPSDYGDFVKNISGVEEIAG
jgi:hypothetical protein